jgi:hypothetical protein
MSEAKPERVACCVPFCRRTFKAEGITEVICGNHWRMIPIRYRRPNSLARRRYRAICGDKAYWEFPAGSPQRMKGHRLARQEEFFWERCKRKAIETALGI